MRSTALLAVIAPLVLPLLSFGQSTLNLPRVIAPAEFRKTDSIWTCHGPNSFVRSDLFKWMSLRCSRVFRIYRLHLTCGSPAHAQTQVPSPRPWLFVISSPLLRGWYLTRARHRLLRSASL